MHHSTFKTNLLWVSLPFIFGYADFLAISKTPNTNFHKKTFDWLFILFVILLASLPPPPIKNKYFLSFFMSVFFK